MLKINNNWTLFLDRDGVINHEIQGHYVTRIDQFVFHDRVAETISYCAKLFKRILIVTNQRGIGRGIMSEQDLHQIHEHMLNTLRSKGGDVQRIYYAPDVENDAPNRKPNTGMALMAKQEFPDIDFKQSVMVGNNISDMEFGRHLGMKTVFIQSTQPDVDQHPLIDFTLPAFADLIQIIECQDG